MKKFLNDFLLMVQMMTRIPINKNLDCTMNNFKTGTMFFSFIGFIIATVQFATYLLFVKKLPLGIVCILIIVMEILLTGALHIDGLGDTFDGFFAFKGGGKDKVIEIMKDSTIGTFSCIAIIFDILIKYCSYSYLIPKNPYIIFIIPMVSRFFIHIIIFIGKPAKKNGSGNLFIKNTTIFYVIIDFCVLILLDINFLNLKFLAIILVIGLIVTLLFNLLCIKKMEGITGDSLGATNELVQIFVLMVLCSIM